MPDESALIQMLTDEFGSEHFDDLRAELPDDPNAWWFKRRRPEDIQFYAVHHTGDGTTPRTFTTTIYNYHKQRFGGYGYHFTIYCYRSTPDRFWWKVRYTRSVLQWGANVKGKNDGVLGCVWVGDYAAQPPDAETVETVTGVFERLFLVLDQWLGSRPIAVGHRDLLQKGYTVCPADWAYGPNGPLMRLNSRGLPEATGDDLQAQLQEALAQINTLQTQLAELQSQVDSLESERSQLQNQVSSLETRITQARAHAQATLDSLAG